MRHLPLSFVLTALWGALCVFSTLSEGSLSGEISDKQKLTIEQLTSIFENGTPDFDYSYIEDIGDGAGVTAGRVGFNTNAGDLLNVVIDYVSMKPKNNPPELAKYIVCLQSIVNTSQYACLYPSVSQADMATEAFKSDGLATVDFGKAWEEAQDRDMKKSQDRFVEASYFNPAKEAANSFGLKSALGLAMIYDTVIQMDSLEQMAAYTQSQFAPTHGGRTTPQNSREELDWLKIYQAERKSVLSSTPIGATTTGRVDSLDQILDSGNLDLALPISFTYDGQAFSLK
jgi:chitosanase